MTTIQKISSAFVGLLLLSNTAHTQSTATLPANVKDGSCYVEVIKPAQFKLITKDVLVRQAYTKVFAQEAIYDTVTVGVMAHAETKEILTEVYDFEVVNPQNTNFQEDVAIINDDFEFDVRDNIKEAIARNWNLANLGMCDSPANDCDLLDWIEVSANYIPKDAQIDGKSGDGNAEAMTSVARLQVKFGGHDAIVPVEYRFYTKVVTIQEEKYEVTEVPAEYRTVTEKVQITDELETQWMEVLCPSQIDPFLMGQIQLALKGRKFYEGVIDGFLSDATQMALENYQVKNNLPVGRLDRSTVEMLGLNYDMFANRVIEQKDILSSK